MVNVITEPHLGQPFFVHTGQRGIAAYQNPGPSMTTSLPANGSWLAYGRRKVVRWGIPICCAGVVAQAAFAVLATRPFFGGVRCEVLQFACNGIAKDFIFLFAPTRFSPTNNIKNAQHSDLRWELLPPAHEPNMLQPGHSSGSSRAFAVCKCTSTVGRRGGPANQVAGRDKREDSDQYSGEGRVCGAVG